MQTFTIKVTGNGLTEADIRRAIWVSGDLHEEDILVEEIV